MSKHKRGVMKPVVVEPVVINDLPDHVKPPVVVETKEVDTKEVIVNRVEPEKVEVMVVVPTDPMGRADFIRHQQDLMRKGQPYIKLWD